MTTFMPNKQYSQPVASEIRKKAIK